jgi:antitoxin ParD1/3/4/toxin ParE1/3/4
MQLNVPPDLEALVQKRLATGAFASAEEERQALNAKIARGLEQSGPGRRDSGRGSAGAAAKTKSGLAGGEPHGEANERVRPFTGRRRGIWTIWQYLVLEAGVSVANHIEAELYEAFETLAGSPGIGHRRDDLTRHPVFFFAARQYMIVYRKSLPLEIAAVIHGKRNLSRILEERL